MAHRIRLHGFWDVAAAGDGGVRHARRFGRPRSLDPGERVWLTGLGLPQPADVAVNGRRVGRVAEADRPFAFDVTPYLQPRNELVVTLTGEGAIGELALEMRAAAG